MSKEPAAYEIIWRENLEPFLQMLKNRWVSSQATRLLDITKKPRCHYELRQLA
jgi:hypothetical protein